MNETFAGWLRENKDHLSYEWAEFKANCKLEGLPAGRFPVWAREIYEAR